MATKKVIPGIDIFLEQKRFTAKRIGLITNPSGITSNGIPSWKAILQKGFNLTGLFGPEHGFRGEAQNADHVSDETFQGITTYSLYGEHLGPTEEMLENLDVMVFDIQNVGSRYYTYLYTLACSMEACMKQGKSFVVLDRPNPIGAVQVEGGPIPEEESSFVGGFGLPNRYGLTVGEYAGYLKGEFFPDVDLQIIWMEGYTRDTILPETGLPWISPSPNIPSVAAAFVYPGTCLFEGTNLSEGRGTTRPFEIIGASWLDGEQFRESLVELNSPGVIFTFTFFRPEFSKYKGESCQGIMLHVMDHRDFKPLYTALSMLWLLKRDYSQKLSWREDWEGNFSFLDRLAGGSYLRDMLDAGKSVEEIYGRARRGYAEYMEIRSNYLFYH